MVKLVALRVLVTCGLLCPFVLAVASGGALALPSQAAAPATRGAPLLFIENVGQFDPQARFRAWGGGDELWLAGDHLWLVLPDQAGDGTALPDAVALRLSFVGANPTPVLEPLEALPTRVSFFIGDDPTAWRAAVPVWSGVRYRDLYPGLDLVVAGPDGGWAWRWEVSGPDGAAALATARLRVEGADTLALRDGRLHLATASGPVTVALPAAAGAPVPAPAVEGADIVAPVGPAWGAGPSLVAAAIGDLAYSTFLGGDQADRAWSTAVDGSGNAYVAGTAGFTAGAAFPTTPGAYDQTNNGGSDVFVVKVNPAGSTLVYATFIGGDGIDEARGLAIDGNGAAIVTGLTPSANFPTTSGAYDTSYNGGSLDAFVTKLNPSGTALDFSTFLGGSEVDSGHAVGLGSGGAVYVTGQTGSPAFPTTPGAHDTSHNGGLDAFVTALPATGASLTYSTYLGGTADDSAHALAVDGSGAAFVAGQTNSINFPATTGAYDQTYNGNGDGFVTRLNAAGSSLIYSSFLGGSGADEQVHGMAMDGSGAIYITGVTRSANFPTTPGAYDESFNGDRDAFVTKFSATLNALAYSTFLGGTDSDWGWAIAVDSSGAAYVAGFTESTNFPTSNAYDGTFNGNNDVFVTRLNPAGSSLAFSTYMGGDNNDQARGLAVRDGYAYVAGATQSTSFPSTTGAYDPSYNGGTDAFLAKVQAAELPPTATPTSTATPTTQPGAPTPTATSTPGAPLPNDRPFAHPAFQARWATSDQGAQGRAYVYGPAPFTDGRLEPYVDSPGGQRLVQYFDKARMELYDPATNLVTAGLLAVELISGRQQNGDATFQQRLPARVAVAGDPDNVFPYYADLDPLRASAANQGGQVANRRYLPGGSFSTDPAAARDPQAVLTGYDPETGHNLPRAFEDFRNNPQFGGVLTIGLAITEPVWVEVRVAGVPKRVLVQAFERRVLTYTPDNPAGLQVEYGNIGRHYYTWRYGS